MIFDVFGNKDNITKYKINKYIYARNWFCFKNWIWRFSFHNTFWHLKHNIEQLAVYNTTWDNGRICVELWIRRLSQMFSNHCIKFMFSMASLQNLNNRSPMRILWNESHGAWALVAGTGKALHQPAFKVIDRNSKSWPVLVTILRAQQSSGTLKHCEWKSFNPKIFLSLNGGIVESTDHLLTIVSTSPTLEGHGWYSRHLSSQGWQCSAWSEQRRSAPSRPSM